ncbi:MAG: TonB-dependent receptor plug domain-containing protein [Bacteroidota bacterium]
MKRFLLLLALILTVAAIFAQSGPLKGRVLSSNKDPLVGAYVIDLASEHHAHTNGQGYFVLPGISAGDSIHITFVGHKTGKIKVSDPSEFLQVMLTEVPLELGEITVSQGTDPLNIISELDIRTNPVISAQEVLRKVPGLFIGQHAGGGKAEQLFLRGFDVDHGTDVSITVDGMPVNMVSHAHGQGYSDLHWLIPELIEDISFGKGPYKTEVGNFATAGHVNFRTKNRLDGSSFMIQGGSFNTVRNVGLFDLSQNEESDFYIGTEYLYSDGPFTSSQNFNRVNLMSKYYRNFGNAGNVTISASYFESEWDASGQIPLRAVEQGLIGRFGALDDTEGGSTSRINFGLTHNKIVNERLYFKNTLYLNRYDFELFSNFTFFLEDQEDGDQIAQRESRVLFGAESQLNYSTQIGTNDLGLVVAAGLRNDQVKDVELSNTTNRSTTREVLQLGDVDETNFYSYVSADLDIDKFTINAGLRVDAFRFEYEDELVAAYEPQSETAVVASPKLNFFYSANDNLQLFLKTGIGFHSNDARVVLDDTQNKTVVPLAYGADIGAIWKPFPRLVFNGALWYLFSEQEFVYVGDAGIVEPSGETERRGFDLGIRYQLNDWLFWDADFNYSFARAVDAPEGEDLIPLAPRSTALSGLTAKKGDFNASIRGRYLQDRPANEDNSVVAKGYTIIDFNASYKINRYTLGVIIENLFDSEWEETQFDTESRIRTASGNLETTPVSEIHFTPGAPFAIRGSLKVDF